MSIWRVDNSMKQKKCNCPNCGSKMKYKGSRCFVCKKCGRTLVVERECEYRKEGLF